MEDSPDNVTRFHILGPTPRFPTGKDRTALFYWIQDKPGAQHDATEAFKVYEINMSDTFSIRVGKIIVFYCEAEFHRDTDSGRKALDMMRTKTDRLFILGSYPQEIDEGEEVNSGT